MNRQTVLEKYMAHVLEHGTEPASVFAFCKKNKWKESDFFAEFSSFNAVRAWFWEHVLETTTGKLEQDETYQSYSAAEKLSAFYFLWTQELLAHRSYALTFLNQQLKGVSPTDSALAGFRRKFVEYAGGIVKEGISKREVAERRFISDRFADGLWLQTLFVLNFWLNDSSQGFEATDAAIEKSVNLVFKLMGENMLDQVFDFGKFLFQTYRNQPA